MVKHNYFVLKPYTFITYRVTCF